MSADEDTELRDLVAQALESNGVLGKIKAQLRASVFLALEEQESIQNKAPLQNQELKKFISTKDGKLVAALVREFLEFFHLDFSLAVFDPESGSGDYYEGRSSLARHLNIPDSNSSQPLLTELLKHGSSVRSNGETTFSFPPNVENHKVSKKTENTSESSKSLSKAKPKTLDMSGDEDSFFDDPVPKSNDNSRSLHSDKSSKDNKFKSTGFLAGAPPLNHSDRKSPDMEDDKDFRKIDKNLADLGFDVPDDDYDDDFESSNVSPIGPTPRSARSDHNVKSIEEEINEDIDDELEDLSVAEDLLKSDNSGNDDLTTDRTVSPTDQSTAFDYAEEVQ